MSTVSQVAREGAAQPRRPASPVLVAAEWILFGTLACWLILAALLVDVEYYDGFEAICNSAYFAGQGISFNGIRAPLMAVLLLPAEALKWQLGLDPFDVRPHHATTAALHLLYLLGCYRILMGRKGRGWASLLAFGCAVPSFVFFSYAPFVSHDILPGLLLLAMIHQATAWLERPAVRPWLILVALGALAPLIKHTFALFWVAILLAIPLVYRPIASGTRALYRRYAQLMAGAAASAALVWLSLGVSLRSAYPALPLLARPYEQVRLLAGEASEHVVFSPWVYLRNAHAYGLLCVVLLAPAVWLALRSSRVFDRLTVVCWLICLALMQLLWLREVRYLAFLAPLTAVLLVQPLRRVLRSRAAAGGLLAVLFWSAVAGPLAPLPEAKRVFSGFHRSNPYRALFAPLEDEGQLPRPTLVNWRMLSSTPPDLEPLDRDRFHRLFHLGRHHVATLYGMALTDLPLVSEEELLHNRPGEPALILASGDPLIHPIEEGTDRRAVERVEQVAYRASSVPVKLIAGAGSDSHGEIELRMLGSQGSDLLVESPALAAHLEGRSFAMLRHAGQERAYRLERGAEPSQFVLMGYTHDGTERESWVRAFHRVSQLTPDLQPAPQNGDSH
jgi:hypothetical protein